MQQAFDFMTVKLMRVRPPSQSFFCPTRMPPHLVQSVTAIEALGAVIESLTEKIETGSATGRLAFHFFVALAKFERSLISDRTKEGLKAARKRWTKGGRKSVLDAKAIKLARALLADRSTRPADIVTRYKIRRSALCNIVHTGT